MTLCAKGHILGVDGRCGPCAFGTNGHEPDDSHDVDPAALLDDVRVVIRRYVVLTDAQADAVALWIAHTHALDAFDVTPYLSVTSPEKRSGKTRLLEVLKRLVARPWMTARTSPAAIYRKVDAESPTLLLDESDAAFKSGDEYSETLRGILNSGFERGGSTTVCVGQGKDISYKEFSTFGAKAIAGIGRLPDTIQDRSIKIAMKRQAPGEKADKLRRRAIEAVTAPLREQMAQWALVAVATLANAEPAIPDELDDRAGDAWEPLVGIADLAGGDWPERARSAALALSVGDGREDNSINVRLLGDIRQVFVEKGTDRIAIADLVAELVAIEDAPWADLKDKPLNPRGLGWRLRQFGVKAKTIRFAGDDGVVRGYHLDWFNDAFARYLPPPEQPTQTDTTVTSDTNECDAFDRCNGFESVTSAKPTHENRNDVTLVTDVPLSQGMGDNAPDFCSICGSVEIAGYTPDGEARCAGHYPLPGDGHLARAAVALGGRINGQRPAFDLCCTDDANAPADFRVKVTT
jgi:hypothetical protein